jgi:hypothetical protein
VFLAVLRANIGAKQIVIQPPAWLDYPAMPLIQQCISRQHRPFLRAQEKMVLIVVADSVGAFGRGRPPYTRRNETSKRLFKENSPLEKFRDVVFSIASGSTLMSLVSEAKKLLAQYSDHPRCLIICWTGNDFFNNRMSLVLGGTSETASAMTELIALLNCLPPSDCSALVGVGTDRSCDQQGYESAAKPCLQLFQECCLSPRFAMDKWFEGEPKVDRWHFESCARASWLQKLFSIASISYTIRNLNLHQWGRTAKLSFSIPKSSQLHQDAIASCSRYLELFLTEFRDFYVAIQDRQQRQSHTKSSS